MDLTSENESSDNITSREEEGVIGKSCRLRSTDFIRKNIKEASKVRRIEYDTDEDDNVSSSSDINHRRSSRCSSISSQQNMKRRMRMSFDSDDSPKVIKERSYRANQRRNETPKLSSIAESRECTEPSKKCYIKQTTCQACKEKWRTPLPTPKTPKIKKTNVIPVENPLCRTNSRNRISMLIHKELYTLESYNKRYSSNNSCARRSLQKEEDLSDSTDYVKLDMLEVARTKLEERKKETQKKVEDFLNDSSK